MIEQEQVIVQWQQPNTPALRLDKRQWLYFSAGSTILFILLIIIALWQHDATFYLAAVVVVVAVFTLFSFTKRNQPELEVLITTVQVVIGEKSYPLADLSGFWLKTEQEITVINLEPKKRSFVPISILSESRNRREIEQCLSKVLPEIEPRATTMSDKVNSYFRL